MPLLGRRTVEDKETQPASRKHILFRRSPSPLGSDIDANNASQRGATFFHRRRASTSDNGHANRRRSSDEGRHSKSMNGASESPGGTKPLKRSSARGTSFSGFFRRGIGSSAAKVALDKDPTIIAARQKVSDAEAAEQEAVRALRDAMMAANEARDQSKMLEKEARHEAAIARAKQAEAKVVRKTTRNLGKHL